MTISKDDEKRLKKLRAFVKSEAKNQADRVKVVAEGIRYITGEVAKPPKRSQHFKYMEERLLPALHAGNALDDWDARVFKLWATGGTGLMELALWLITEAGKYPDDDVIGRFIELAPDIDVEDETMQRYFPGAAHNSKGKLTSIGRWLKAKGKKVGKAPKPEPDKPERDVSEGYAFDRYVEAIREHFVDKFKAPKKKMITEVSVYIPQSRPLPELVILEAGDQLVYGVCPPTTPALEAVSDGDDDEVLAPINEDLDEEIAWGDYGELPAAILNYELVNTAHTIADYLREQNVLATDAKVGLLIDDEHFADAQGFARSAKSAFKKLPKPARAALTAACYANKRAASWLTT